MNIFLKIYYNEMGRIKENFFSLTCKVYINVGVKMVFYIWYGFQMVFLLNIFFVSNLYIFLETSENFIELNHLNIKVTENFAKYLKI